jgi:putative transposase
MARLPRLTLPGFQHYVIQSGNNQQAIVSTDADRETLMLLIAESARKFGVAVHGYLVLDTQFHLLATPGEVTSLSQLMQAVGRGYVRYFNQQQSRSGTLWEGRYRSTVIEPERFLLPCMAYMDLGPVRAGLAGAPAQYQWSSHSHYAGLRTDAIVTPHAMYWQLGNTPFAREVAYADMVAAGLSLQQEMQIPDAIHTGWPLASAVFIAQTQSGTTRRLVKARAGRPPARDKE